MAAPSGLCSGSQSVKDQSSEEDALLPDEPGTVHDFQQQLDCR